MNSISSGGANEPIITVMSFATTTICKIKKIDDNKVTEKR